MLISFSVENYRSIKDRVTLSMERIPALKEKLLDNNNICNFGNTDILKSAVLYGANASGKSNVLQALWFFSKQIHFSATNNSPQERGGSAEPFLFSNETKDKPSLFEVEFIADDKLYRYGFSMKKLDVCSEWLFVGNKEIFLREEDQIQVNKKILKKENELIDKTRDDALFISVCIQWNSDLINKIFESFLGNILVVNGVNDKHFQNLTMDLINESTEYKKLVLNLLKNSDLGIDDIEIKLVDVPEELKQGFDGEGKLYVTNIIHKVIDTKGSSKYELDLRNESEGTIKLFNMAGVIVNSIVRGKVLVIDEFDARLHPEICEWIINFFNNENNNNAQLIISTHNTNFLSNKLFRRDQIWFTEKGNDLATSLYSLASFKERSDASYDKQYLKGKYGAIPYIEEFVMS